MKEALETELNERQWEEDQAEYGAVPSRWYECCEMWVLIEGVWHHARALGGCSVLLHERTAKVRPVSLTGLMTLQSADKWWKNRLVNYRLRVNLERQRMRRHR